jgi:Ca-activated chloride channel family protein
VNGRPRAIVLLLALALVLLPACSLGGNSGNPANGNGATLRVISGSENRTLEPLIQQFAKRERVNVEVTYKGSVDIMLELEHGANSAYDAVWPANSLWIALGDKQQVVKNATSIMRSPVVFGVKRSVAERLGWTGRDVTVNDILAASESGRLRFMMTSASQSNSGAAAYFGFLYAFAGNPDILTAQNLQDPAVRDKVRRILGAVNRTAGSSGWLKDLFLDRYDAFDAMVNYEAVLIETNQELARTSREPLYAIYPTDGLAVADSPLGYVNKGDAAKEAAVRKLQAHLLATETQAEIQKLGRRTGPLGLNPGQVDRTVFRREWGIDVERVISPIKFPPPDVIREALTLYQTAFRKPSLTVFCLDFSGSMQGRGEEDLKAAMRTLLDQGQASRYLLQAAPEDVTVVIPFSDRLLAEWTVTGNNPQALLNLSQQITSTPVTGGTDIYSPAIRALELIKGRNYENYATAVILMTDGESNTGKKVEDLQRSQETLGVRGVPIYSILFGSASQGQLDKIAALTSGRVFDGRKNLIDAFREAKGYN